MRTLLEATTSTHVLFSGLLSESEGSEGVEALRRLVDAFYPMECKKGQMVMEQGSAGDWFAVVESGCFVAMTMGGWQQAPDGSGKQVTQREKYSTPGDSFGELGMLYDCPRAATITTQSAGRLWVLERSSLQQLAKISGNEYRSVGVPEFMRGLDVFGSLSDDQRNAIADAASVQLYEPRTTVFEAGEEASALFCVMQGEAHVLSAQGEQLLRFQKGEIFGTQAVSSEPHPKRQQRVAAARQQLRLLRLPREALGCGTRVHRELPSSLRRDLQRVHVYTLLRFVPFLKQLSIEERHVLVDALKVRTFNAGDKIVQEGMEGDEMFIIQSGVVKVSRKPKTTVRDSFVPRASFEQEQGGEGGGGMASTSEEVLGRASRNSRLGSEMLTEGLGPGDFFGEMALLKSEARMATITALSESVVCVVISKAMFDTLLGPLSEVLARHAARRLRENASKSDVKIDAADLDVRQTLGVGSFGRVRLVVAPSGEGFALKCMRKSEIAKAKQVEHIMSEKRTMEMCHHPFLPFLVATWESETDLLLMMELCQGGELFTYMQAQGTLSEESARFYSGCVVAAFTYLHELDIAYRDLKPENLMLDSSGYIKVVDFGFAKVISDRTMTFCGTHEYLAPEIIAGTGHGMAVDWWALGVLIYEMLQGKTPFVAEKNMEILKNIKAGSITFSFMFEWRVPRGVAIINSLLTADPKKRLGSLSGFHAGGSRQVRDHPFFAQLDFVQLERKELIAPYVPTVSSAIDTSHFLDDDDVDDEESEDDESLVIIAQRTGKESLFSGW